MEIWEEFFLTAWQKKVLFSLSNTAINIHHWNGPLVFKFILDIIRIES